MRAASHQNSNLVLQADRGKRRGEDGTGEVESLWGKTKGMKMGDRLTADKPPELEAKLQKAKVGRAGVGACFQFSALVMLLYTHLRISSSAIISRQRPKLALRKRSVTHR
jgi:hypothetical protein